MGAYCGSAARIYDANEAIRVNNTGPRSQELLASVNVTAKGRDGRIPFVQACKYGRQRMIEFMIKHDRKQRISAEFVDAGLLQCCGGDTTRNLVFILVEVSGANVNAQDVFGNTPLINLAKKNAMTSRFTLGQRLETAVYILEKGARINHKNREGLSPITVAVRDQNERMALLLAEKGADIMLVYNYMSTVKGQSRNWVGGSVLSKYAFNYPRFVDDIKQWFWDSFGDAPRGDESLNEYQLKVFVGRMLKEAYRAGLMPKAAFFSDGAMAEADVEDIIERRARDMLHGYLSSRKKKINKFFWAELLPIVRSFYMSLWNQERPADADADLELETTAEDTEGKAAKERVDYGYGTLAEAALTPETGSAMVQSTLPADWTAVVDPASGQVYYVNIITKATSWQPPGGMAAYEP